MYNILIHFCNKHFGYYHMLLVCTTAYGSLQSKQTTIILFIFKITLDEMKFQQKNKRIDFVFVEALNASISRAFTYMECDRQLFRFCLD